MVEVEKHSSVEDEDFVRTQYRVIESGEDVTRFLRDSDENESVKEKAEKAYKKKKGFKPEIIEVR